MNTDEIFWPRYVAVALAVIVGVAAAWNSMAFQFGGICAGFGGCQGPDYLLASLAIGSIALGVALVVYHRWGGAAEPEPSNVVEAAEVEEPPRP